MHLCRREGVAAAFVLMPEGSEFRGWYSPATLAQLHGFLGGLSREFRAPIIDAREWVPDDGFADSHHLVLHGATAFTERLGEQALLPLVRQRAERGDATVGNSRAALTGLATAP
jgi:hypothetical protein